MNLTKNLIRARTVDQKSWISDFEASIYLNLIRNLIRARAIDQKSWISDFEASF